MTCAIQSITINNFKSIANLTLDLGKVNVLIGENGAGKSNVLEAIGVLSAAAGGSTSYARLKDRGIRLSAPEVFKLALRGKRRQPLFALDVHFVNNLHYHISLSPKREDTGDNIRYWTEDLKANGKKIASRGPRGVKVGPQKNIKLGGDDSVITVAKTLGVLEEYEIALNILEKYAIYAPSTPILRNIATDESTKNLLGLYGGGLPEALGSLQKTNSLPSQLFKSTGALFPWIKAFGRDKPSIALLSQHVHPGGLVIRVDDKRMSDAFNTLLAYDVSEGVLYTLFLFVLILHPSTPPFFAVDNMDSALNPRLADALLTEAIKLIKEQPNKQMVLTTHNPSMLNALDLFDDDVRLFVVERSEEDGSTIVRRIKPLGDMTREQWRELMQGHTLSSLWTSGAFGGLPQISF